MLLIPRPTHYRRQFHFHTMWIGKQFHVLLSKIWGEQLRELDWISCSMQSRSSGCAQLCKQNSLKAALRNFSHSEARKALVVRRRPLVTAFLSLKVSSEWQPTLAGLSARTRLVAHPSPKHPAPNQICATVDTTDLLADFAGERSRGFSDRPVAHAPRWQHLTTDQRFWRRWRPTYFLWINREKLPVTKGQLDLLTQPKNGHAVSPEPSNKCPDPSATSCLKLSLFHRRALWKGFQTVQFFTVHTEGASYKALIVKASLPRVPHLLDSASLNKDSDSFWWHNCHPGLGCPLIITHLGFHHTHKHRAFFLAFPNWGVSIFKSRHKLIAWI